MKTATDIMTLTVAGLLTLAPARLALAGDSTPDKPPASDQTPGATNKPSFWQGLTSALAPTQHLEAFRSGVLIGKPVQGSNNAKLGTLEDCLIDLPQGRIAACLIKSGGVLGIGEAIRAVPPALVSYSDGTRTLAINTDNRTFELAPRFDVSRIDDQSQLVQAYRQFGQTPYWSQAGTSQKVREAEGSSTGSAAGQESLHLRRATQLIGFTVLDSAQADAGVLHDLVLDLKSGRVLYVVLAQGGILGVGDRFYPLPPTALSYMDSGKALALSMTRAQLETAPQVSKAAWASLDDPKRASDIYAFYHAPMYWVGPHPEMTKGATELMRQPVRERDNPGETNPGTTPPPAPKQ